MLQAEALAAGVMPALASLLPTAAAAEQVMPAVLELLELLLQQDKAAAVDAVKCDMLPALAAVYEHCCTSGTREAIDAVLLLLFKPPLVSALVSLPPAPAAGGGKGQASSRLTAIDSKPLAAAAGTAASMLPAALPASSEAGQCLQHVQLELGRCCGTASVLAAMQLMSQGGWTLLGAASVTAAHQRGLSPRHLPPTACIMVCACTTLFMP